MSRPWIDDWRPNDEGFWARTGQRVARRNLVFSIFAEFLGFSVWLLWSVTAVRLGQAGFDFTTSQLFTLVSVPALVGAVVRIPYTLAVPRFGGRNWTTFSAALLLLPVALLIVLVSNPNTPYWAFLLGAATAGFGGGNFASSMANISFFYPDKRKGLALGLNAAGGNVGVAGVQLLVPLVVTAGSIAVIGGSQSTETPLYLQNAGLIWIPFIVAASICAWLFMDNLSVVQAPLADQAVVLKRKQTWVSCWLYVGTFGSFIGYSAGLPLLIKTQFPEVGLSAAFLGPLVGSVSRPLGGWLADRLGGARITFGVFVAMGAAVGGVMFFLGQRGETWAFTGFLCSFLVLFILSGIGNGSTFRMIPIIFRALHLAEAEGRGTDAEAALARARRETAAVLGFTSAIGAFGGWLIPQAYGVATRITGEPQAAFAGFIAFYVSCLGITWWFYLRRTFALTRAPNFAAAGV
ncbi:MAG: NarK family nitrate/nitrite MFS transporter [Acidimicrobiales bacterium]